MHARFFTAFYLKPNNLKGYVALWKLPDVLAGCFIRTLNKPQVPV